MNDAVFIEYEYFNTFNEWEELNCLTKCSAKSNHEIIEAIHRSDFNFTYNFMFGKFSLKDYEEVSTVLNNYVIRKMTNNHVLIPRRTGVSVCQK